MITKDVKVFWMTEQELDLFSKAFKAGRLCEKCQRGGVYLVTIGYDTGGDYFFIKDFGQEVKTVPDIDSLVSFLEGATERISRGGDLIEEASDDTARTTR